jgi:hypothetical protein
VTAARYIKEESEKGARWRYKGPEYGRAGIHYAVLIEPGEVVTASATHGWLGEPEQFLKEFDILQP